MVLFSFLGNFHYSFLVASRTILAQSHLESLTSFAPCSSAAAPRFLPFQGWFLSYQLSEGSGEKNGQQMEKCIWDQRSLRQKRLHHLSSSWSTLHPYWPKLHLSVAGATGEMEKLLPQELILPGALVSFKCVLKLPSFGRSSSLTHSSSVSRLCGSLLMLYAVNVGLPGLSDLQLSQCERSSLALGKTNREFVTVFLATGSSIVSTCNKAC